MTVTLDDSSDTLEVERIAADGDGLATTSAGKHVFLPFTLPGERVRSTALTKRGDGWTGMATILGPSPDRQPAPCPHFGDCGGCTLQHWQAEPYTAWKSGQVRAALERAGYKAVPLGPLARTPQNARRRVDLALMRDGKTVSVGLHRHRSREVVDLQICLVLDPALVRLIGALRVLLPGLGGLRRAGSAVANLADNGVDLLLRTDGPLDPADRSALAGFARDAGVIRVSWAPLRGPAEPASQFDTPCLTLGGVRVEPGPGAFLQASPQGESAIVAAVLAGLLPSRKPVVELFAGIGTISFPLAATGRRVIAYEGDADAHAALRRASGGTRVEAIRRDLQRQPLAAKELDVAEMAVLDPPFTGALAQMPALAASRLRRVIYVSCNPAALARDARLLREAGYGLVSVTPIDQFLWSAAVECVAVFEKTK
jgi:23S rRNA (uracil1939-C5)-methyltransferase